MKSYLYIPVGKVDVLIDRDSWNWVRFLSLTIDRKGYVVASSRFMLHRMIRGLVSGDNQMIDHINGNKLDNRKCNLRICNSKENTINSKAFKQQKYSHYKGVSRAVGKNLKKEWCSVIVVDGKSIYLGYWETEREAALAYDAALRKFYPGKHVKFNIPNGVLNTPVPNVDYDRHSRDKSAVTG